MDLSIGRVEITDNSTVHMHALLTKRRQPRYNGLTDETIGPLFRGSKGVLLTVLTRDWASSFRIPTKMHELIIR